MYETRVTGMSRVEPGQHETRTCEKTAPGRSVQRPRQEPQADATQQPDEEPVQVETGFRSASQKPERNADG